MGQDGPMRLVRDALTRIAGEMPVGDLVLECPGYLRVRRGKSQKCIMT